MGWLGRVLTAWTIAFVCGVGMAGGQQPRPNVVLINVDDLGWTDLSVQGSTYYETPHIDALASAGMRFTNAYAAAAICSPSRAAILTGRYPARVGITDWIRARFQGGEIPSDHLNPTGYVSEPGFALATPPNPLWMEHAETTLAEILKQAGYATAHIGKWHLGADEWYPRTQGLDVNIGGADLGQPPTYFDPYYSDDTGSIPTLEPRRAGEYLTDREADEAVRLIEGWRDRPFLLYYAPYAVHTPIQGKPALVERYRQKPATNQQDPEYAAMVHSVDQAVGRILDALVRTDVADRTIVVFTSDNGGLEGPTDNAPLRSGKGFPYEGGIRVPLIVRWPGEVPPFTVSHETVSGIDLMPTILEATGTTPPSGVSMDGLSLLEHLRSGATAPLDRQALFWHFPHYRLGHTIPPYSIVRRRSWKLIKWLEGPTYELYNLQEDIEESVNLAESRPDLVVEMDGLLQAWYEETGAKLPRPASSATPAHPSVLLGGQSSASAASR